jgi:leader peptidase (prepilin peptidase)/N-methyltransferase
MILFLVWIFLVGACIGSFLNVVIYRLPNEMSIITPRSHCPHCKKTLSAWHNIPIFSFLRLKGKCFYCKQKISPTYFLVELMTALLSVILAFHFGLDPKLIGALFLTWCLIPLVVIDFKHQILPDEITQPLIWIGLIVNMFSLFTSLESAVLGAIFGYMSLWLVMHLYKLITGKIGMGHGDFKLLAVLGAWFGWQALPTIILISSIAGIILGGGYLLIRKKGFAHPIPFGPFIACAGWIFLLCW